MAEVINGLAQHVAAIGLVDCNLGHRKVRLRKRLSRRIHADEDLGHGFDVQVFGQLDHPHMVVHDAAQALKHLEHCVLRTAGVRLAVGRHQLEHAGLGVKHRRHIRQPRRVFANGRVRHLEPFFLGVECDADLHRLIVFRQHLCAQQGRHERRDTLLPVDQDALAGRRGAVLELHRRVAPCNQVAHRVALVERIQQVAHFGRIPNKRALDFWDGNLARFHPGQQGLDGVGRDGVALCGHGSIGFFEVPWLGSQRAAEGLIKKGFCEFVEGGEFALVEGFEALGFFAQGVKSQSKFILVR